MHIRRSGPVLNAQLSENSFHMFLYGALAYSENYGDLTVPFSFSHPMQYFRLACCEAKPRSKASWIELLLFRNRRACPSMERLVIRVCDHCQEYTRLRNLSLANCQQKEHTISPYRILHSAACALAVELSEGDAAKLLTGRAETLAGEFSVLPGRLIHRSGDDQACNWGKRYANFLPDVDLNGTNRETDPRGICGLISKKV
jgi:hypothetical protein